jgi:hypothetical protein
VRISIARASPPRYRDVLSTEASLHLVREVPVDIDDDHIVDAVSLGDFYGQHDEPRNDHSIL